MNELRELIAARITESGPISLAEFMELSLYHPELGYYARAARNSGRAGDFFTSVDVGPLFGELLARQFAEMWRIIRWTAAQSDAQQSSARSSPVAQDGSSPARLDLVEAGASDGRLSKDILDAAARNDPDFYAAIGLSLVERSPAARVAQQAALGPHASLLKYSGPAFPHEVRGVIFANELLDALPVHQVVMTDGGLREVFIGYEHGRFVEQLQEPATPKITEYLARAGASLPRDGRAEVNLAAEAWVKAAAASLQQGFLVVIDYGHDERQLYGGSHAAGTLTSFKRHTQFADILQSPGEHDLTAHVDLTAVTRAAEAAGLQTLGCLDQTYFLIGLGIAELERMPLRQRLAMKTLLLPGGLGSTHKVLIFGKHVGTPSLQGLSYRVRVT